MTDITIPTPVGTFAIFADTHSYGLQHPKADGTLGIREYKGRQVRTGTVTYHQNPEQALDSIVRDVGRRRLMDPEVSLSIQQFLRELHDLRASIGESLEDAGGDVGA